MSAPSWEIAEDEVWILDWMIANHDCDQELRALLQAAVTGKRPVDEVLYRVACELSRFSTALRSLDTLDERFPDSQFVGPNFAQLAWYHGWLLRCAWHLKAPEDMLLLWLTRAPKDAHPELEAIAVKGLLVRDIPTGRYRVPKNKLQTVVDIVVRNGNPSFTATTLGDYLWDSEGKTIKQTVMKTTWGRAL